MEFLKNLLNVQPQFEGQCIVGTSNLPLIAARIHPKDGRSFLAWRSSMVYCGFALDGGAQQLINHLKNYTDSKTIYVDPIVYRHRDIMGALQAVAPGYTFVSTDKETPCAGCIHVVVPKPNTPIVQLYKPSATVTAEGVKMGIQPVSQVIPVSATAGQLAAELSQPSQQPSDLWGELPPGMAGGARHAKRKRSVRRSLKKMRNMKF